MPRRPGRGLIGFTAGIAIGAAMDNDYYYGPYGWHGGPYMYNDAWDDWYDDREDAREDWYDNREDAREDYADHREDMADSRSERASDAQQQRGDRASTAQQQRTERQQSGQSSAASTAQTARSSGGTSTSARATGQAATPTTQSAQRRHLELSSAGAGSRSVEHRGRAEWHRVRRVLQLLEWQVRAIGQRAWTEQPLGQRWWRQPRWWWRRPQRWWGGTTAMIGGAHGRRSYLAATLAAWLIACLSVAACARTPEDRRYTTAEDAARDLIETVKKGNLDQLLALFGPEGRELVASSDAATGRRNREVFVAAAAQQWRLEDRGADTKELVIGNEDWPFPIPLVRDARGWRFDTEAGKEEIARAADRTQRAGRHRHLPRLRRGPACLRAERARRQAGRHLRAPVQQRAWRAQRLVPGRQSEASRAARWATSSRPRPVTATSSARTRSLRRSMGTTSGS